MDRVDENKFFIVSDSIAYQYSLSTAGDVTSASYDNKSKDFGGSYIRGIYLDPYTKKKIWLLPKTGIAVSQYSLSTAGDISTATTDNKSTAFGNGECYGFSFSLDGKSIFAHNFYNYSIRFYSKTIPLSADDEGVSYITSKFISFPSSFDDKDITAVGAFVYDAGTGTSGTTLIDIQKRTISGTTAGDWTSILSTGITIDFKEYDSRDAATQPVINSTYKTISSKDQFRVVVGNLSATDIYGLGVWFDIG